MIGDSLLYAGITAPAIRGTHSQPREPKLRPQRGGASELKHKPRTKQSRTIGISTRPEFSADTYNDARQIKEVLQQTPGLIGLQIAFLMPSGEMRYIVVSHDDPVERIVAMFAYVLRCEGIALATRLLTSNREDGLVPSEANVFPELPEGYQDEALELARQFFAELDDDTAVVS